MATNNSTPDEDPKSGSTGGFEFTAGTDSHEIEISYSWQHVDRICVDDDGDVVRSEDTSGRYGNDESFECVCGATFACEPEAKVHLGDKRVRGPPVPTAEQPGTLSWQDESDTAFDRRVEFIGSLGGSAGLVTNGAEYLIETARATNKPPANYAFNEWAPLQSGRLSNHRNEPLFSARLLSRALATLSSGYQYVPER